MAENPSPHSPHEAAIDFDPRPLVWQGNRVFVSPALGCPAKCIFCYLGSFNGASPKSAEISGGDLWVSLIESPEFVAGIHGTLISIGCLSESLAPHAFFETLNFLLAAKGTCNPLQVATRWAPAESLAHDFILACSSLNITVFHSLTCIEPRRIFEAGTPSISKRQVFIDALRRNGVRQVLYVKPVIPQITIRDAPALADFAIANGITDIVVGPLYADKNISARLLEAGVPNGGDFFLEKMPLAALPTLLSDQSNEEDLIRSVFSSKNLTVHRHGSDCSRSFFT